MVCTQNISVLQWLTHHWLNVLCLLGYGIQHCTDKAWQT